MGYVLVKKRSLKDRSIHVHSITHSLNCLIQILTICKPVEINDLKRDFKILPIILNSWTSHKTYLTFNWNNKIEPLRRVYARKQVLSKLSAPILQLFTTCSKC